MKTVVCIILLAIGLCLAGCDKRAENKNPPAGLPVSDSNYDRSKIDPLRINKGRELYLKNCTVCHGLNAEGASDWRQRDKDGKFPAPPLNGTGHAWHHP